jgi:hypothetical protein
MISDRRSIARFMKDVNTVDTNLRYSPSLRECYTAYRRLNNDIFKNKLPRSKLCLKRLRGYYGECYYDGKAYNIKLTKYYKNKQFFLMVLAHEMVHVYEHYYFGTMSHSANFYMWRPTFAKFCIPLSEFYRDVSMDWHASRKFTQISRK